MRSVERIARAGLKVIVCDGAQLTGMANPSPSAVALSSYGGHSPHIQNSHLCDAVFVTKEIKSDINRTMERVIANIRKELKSNSDRKVKESGQRFFKEAVKMYGVKTPTVITIAKRYLKAITHYSKKEMFAVCEELWKSGYIEESFIACHFVYSQRKQFTAGDIHIFEYWINSYISNWASCDTFCNHTVSALIEMYPEHTKKLCLWAKSKNRWLKRAGAVSLIIPARNGKFLETVLDIATIELTDSDDMVQKGYGWALKVASNKHQNEVFEFVMSNKHKMPRTALRYAIEKMPARLKKQAMAK